MLKVEVIKQPKREHVGDSLYTSDELANYFKAATEQLMIDIRAIEEAERESWAKVRRGEVP